LLLDLMVQEGWQTSYLETCHSPSLCLLCLRTWAVAWKNKQQKKTHFIGIWLIHIKSCTYLICTSLWVWK
jgi:hypothetical protein